MLGLMPLLARNLPASRCRTSTANDHRDRTLCRAGVRGRKISGNGLASPVEALPPPASEQAGLEHHNDQSCDSRA